MADSPPHDWTERRFGEFCRAVDRRARELANLPLLSVTKDKGVCLQSETNRKQIGNADLAGYKVAHEGEFAFAPMALYYGAIGRVAVPGSGLISPAYEVFDVDETVSGEFFEQLIRSPRMVAAFDALAEGGNRHGKRKNTSFEAFCTIRRPFPSRAEQDAIAELLVSADRLVRDTERMIDQLRLAKTSTMRELLLKGHPAHATKLVPLRESWAIGRIASPLEKFPSHWKLVRVVHVAKLESGHTPSRQHPEYWDGNIPWLSLGDTSELKKLCVEQTSECITQAGIDNSSARLLPANTVVLSRTAVRGLCSRLAKPMATSQDFVAFVCGPEVLPAFLVQLFRHMQREWRRLEEGSSPTNKTLYFSVFKSLKFLLPPPKEQEAIAQIGESFDKRIIAEVHYLEQLRHSRRAVAQALLSGCVRVSGGKTRSPRASGAPRGR